MGLGFYRLALGLAASFSLALLSSCVDGFISEPSSDSSSIASSFAAERLQQIKDGGVFKVAVCAENPPFAFRDQEGQFAGLEIDIVNSVARELQLKPKFFEASPDAVSGYLRDGTADLACGGFNCPSISRQFLVSTLEYLGSGQKAVIRSEAAAFINDVKQLDSDKITLITISGSTGSGIAGKLFPKAKSVSVASAEKGLEELKASDDKALILDNVEILKRGSFAEDSKVKALPGFLTNERLAMAIRRGDDAWKAMLEEGMKRAMASGEIGRFVGRYFPNATCESISVKASDGGSGSGLLLKASSDEQGK